MDRDQGIERDEEMEQAKAVLLVPKAHVKHVKSALEKHDQFDRASKITPQERDDAGKDKDQRMRIPTTIPYSITQDDHGSDVLSTLLTTLALTHLSHLITLTPSTPLPPPEKNPLRRALTSALTALPASILSGLSLTPSALTTTFPDAYSIYPPMLLLPAGTFTAPAWQDFLAAHPPFSPVADQLWSHVAHAVKATHVALNSPIPASTTTTAPDSDEADENALRSPLHLTLLYGNWGPTPTPRAMATPTPRDFADATWVRTCQNGIWQVWAPRYTMFSRGNMREKTRILKLPDAAFEAGGAKGSVAAVDLYAGIGYFSFSYRKRGVRMICWEMNPWSVEGLRRGAELNGWSTRIMSPPSPPPSSSSSPPLTQPLAEDPTPPDFTIFPHSNTTALADLAPLLPSLPPVRHANLGLLPLSRPTWHTALRALDARAGGWIHAHENVGEVEMDARRDEVEREFARLMRAWEVEAGAVRARAVSVVHVERVKLYAPGVVHVVFDVWVEGTG